MIESDQLMMEAMSDAPSCMTYSDQVPFGEPPAKVDRLTSPLGVGAGGTKRSPPDPWLAGL
jgi:hypothetical protein